MHFKNTLGSAVYQYLDSVPIEEHELCFQKWIGWLKSCIQTDGVFSEGQSKLNDKSICSMLEAMQVTLVLEHSLMLCIWENIW